MNPRAGLACLAADAVRWGITHLTSREGGNIPGALALRLDPDVLSDLAADLDDAVVLTGTNGKTTTTGLTADALGASGAAVVCNRAGNNMESGIAAALIEGRRSRGEGRRTGCFECDELYTVRVLPKLRPRSLTLLNLFRDQLDRYGEIDHTQDVIAQALERSPATTLVFNADDPLCAAIAGRVGNDRVALGIDEPTGLESDRISDSRFCARCNAPLDYEYVHYGQLGKYRCPRCGWERPRLDFAVTYVTLGCDGYSFDVEDRRDATDAAGSRACATYHLRSRYTGLYMVYNIAAAFVTALLDGADLSGFQGVLDAYQPASGRGKTYELDGGYSVVSNLAKNPTGFDRMIADIKAHRGQAMAFFLNDNDADGHDVSWIWDVDFERLRELEARVVFVGGTRREDMAVRIKYAELGAPVVPIESLEDALGRLPAYAPSDKTLHVVANYTAFPPVVSELGRLQGSWRAGDAPKAPATRDASPQRHACPPSLLLDRPLRIVHLYPDALNLYGDGGNIASLQKRCEWRGIPVRVDQVRMGDRLDLSDADVVLLGGGSDRDQLAVAKELQAQRQELAAYVDDGGVLLAICGGYQLLGHYYMMSGEKIEGLHILDLTTEAGDTRLIGNVATRSAICELPIVGFENHAGRTYLGSGEKPLGACLIPGTGNNGADGGEGVLHGGVVGTYFHGPVLPKNPGVTDWLLATALGRRGADATLCPLGDEVELSAHDVALRIARRER